MVVVAPDGQLVRSNETTIGDTGSASGPPSKGGADPISQAATTGRVDVKAAALGMVPGLNLVSRKGGGAGPARAPPGRGGSTAGPSGGGGGSGPGCRTAGRTHSFDPATRVLMADGTSRPIADINIGDQVVATDPVAGTSSPKPVTQLHRNTDRELTDIQVRTGDDDNRGGGDGGGVSVVVETTPNHPFWDEDRQAWVDAGDLTPGTRLRVAGRGEVTVVSVETRRDQREMRDLTVADTHTYHVIAGDHPVLVHNNNFTHGHCDIPTLKGYAKQIREAGDSAQSRENRVIAVGQDAAGNLSVGSSNRLDRGQKEMAAQLRIRPVRDHAGSHAEEDLLADNNNLIDPPLRRVASDNQGACGISRHNCAGQMDALGIEHN
jgi:hypothetical protein